MTERLYYNDCYLVDFSARVQEVRNLPLGKAALLDRTAFYPASGGQPSDQGWLGLARVVEVEETEGGEILHYIEGELGEEPIKGIVDWPRRFDHMQQHSGQHLLTQAFIQIAAAPTASFHLGRQSSTIDIEMAELTPEILERVEEEANRIIFENRPICIRFVTPDQIHTLDLRKEPTRTGTLRVVEIEQYDQSACGGTHVRRTGELGSVHILGSERYKSYYRIEFVCGWRALRDIQHQRCIVRNLSRQLSTNPEEFSTVFQKLTEENKDRDKQIRDLNDRLTEFEAELLFQTAERRGRIAVIKAVLTPCSAERLKHLAVKLMQKGPCVITLAAGGESSFVVLGNSSAQAVDSGRILSEIIRHYGGRGGGRPELAQGGGVPGSKAHELLEALLEAVFKE